MSRVDNISDTLGQYMLKGWVLTDTSCPTPGCAIPLMRSPKGRTPVSHFCANCDVNLTLPNIQSSIAPGLPTIAIAESSPSVTSSSNRTRSSTPPTEISSALSSPTFALPVDTEESLRRRQQSDTASAEIGKRLLKGWAMLADECPNVRCYGVPLVRPPKAGPDQDPRKECVVCGTVYISDTSGLERLVSSDVRGTAVPAHPMASDSRTNGYQVFSDETSQGLLHAMPPKTSAQDMKFTPSLQPVVSSPPDTKLPPTTTMSALKVAGQSLELSLHSLSERLTYYCSGQAATNPETIALTADAIGRAADALSQVKQLQWSEIQSLYI